MADIYIVIFVFFFFKQKTAYEMRISDWSSDVCSSDLVDVPSAMRWQQARTVVTRRAVCQVTETPVFDAPPNRPAQISSIRPILVVPSAFRSSAAAMLVRKPATSLPRSADGVQHDAAEHPHAADHEAERCRPQPGAVGARAATGECLAVTQHDSAFPRYAPGP